MGYLLLLGFGLGLCVLVSTSMLAWHWAADRLRRHSFHATMRRVSELERLADRARWRHAPGARGRQARRAWRRLARESKGIPNGRAADLLWRAWLWDPDDKGWALQRQRRERPFADLRAAIAASPPRVGNWPGLAAFCVRNNLVPTDPVELARFYTLARQPEQRRALDPDSALLAAAYRAADPDAATALREALTVEGDLDVLRVVVAGSDASSRVTDLTDAERGYLTRQFVAGRDWARLWRLAADLPVAEPSMRW